MRQKYILIGSILGMGFSFLPVVVLLTLIYEDSQNECWFAIIECYITEPQTQESIFWWNWERCAWVHRTLWMNHTPYHLVYFHAEMAEGELRDTAYKFGILFKLQEMCELTLIIFGTVFSIGRIYDLGAKKKMEIGVNYSLLLPGTHCGNVCLPFLQI